MITILFLVISCIKSNIIELGIAHNEDRRDFYIGEEKVNFFIDMDQNFSCINSIRSKLSDTSQLIESNKNNLSHEGKEFKYQIAKDKLISIDPPLKFNDFHFFYIYEFNRKFNKLAFGYNIKDKSMSIVYLAYANNLISQLQFGLKISTKEKENTILYLGGYPKDFLMRKYRGYCKVSSTNSSWGCQLNYVMINDKKYISNEFVMFTNTFNELFAPGEFLNFTKKIIEEKGFNCSASTNNLLKCQCNANLLNNVDLVFNGYKLNLSSNDLFQPDTENDDLCIFVFIMERKVGKFNNMWLMGENFMKIYAILFDYKSSTLTFFSQGEITIISISSILIINIVFLFIFTIPIAIIKIKNI